MRVRDVFVLLFILLGSSAALYTFTSSPTGASIFWEDRTVFYLSSGTALTLDLDASFSSDFPLNFTFAEQPELYVVLDGGNLIVTPSPGASGSIPLSITASDGIDIFEQTVIFVAGEMAPSMETASEPVFGLLIMPEATGINLNSTNPATNDTAENLTLYVNVTDAEGDPIFNITDWRVDNVSMAVLNMPFETNQTGDTSAGAIRDYSIFEHDGTLGSGTASFAPVWTNLSIVGGAYTFDGSDDIITIAHTANQGTENTFVSVEAWINTPEATSGYDKIVVKPVAGGSDPYNCYALSRDSGVGNISFQLSTGGAGTLTGVDTTGVIAVNTWLHVVGTYDGARIRVYTNGTLNNSAPKNGRIGSCTASIGIGGNPASGGEFFAGTIDEVRVYNRTLSSSEVYQLYQEGLTGRQPMILNANETVVDDVWTVALTPNDHSGDGTTNISNNVTITGAYPNITGINLNSTYPAFTDTNQNLTLYVNTTTPVPPVFNITDWRLYNGTAFSSIAALNLPFEFNTSSFAADAIRDYSIFENNGTLGGGTAANAPLWNDTGMVGGAYTFDGSSDYIRMDDSPSLNITGTNLTLEAWINSPETFVGEYDRIIVKEVAGNADPYTVYALFRNGGASTIGFGVATGGAGTGASVSITSGISANTWYHVVGTYDGTNMRIYINGTLNNTAAKTGNIASSARPVVLGANTESSIEYFKGTMDEVKIYNRTLSAEQIMENYLEGLSHHNVMNLTSQETVTNETWLVAVTPNNHNLEGITLSSNNVTIVDSVTNVTSCPVTIATSVGVSNNITSNGTCITVAGSNIMINCQNYNITGNGTGYGVKVNAGLSNVIIANCNMSSFASGIFADPVNLTIENSTFENSTVGLDLANTVNSTVRNNTFRNNTIGLRLNASQNNTISNNTFSTDNNISAWLIDSLNDTFATTNFTTFLVLENSSASGGMINFTEWVYIENASNLNSTVYTVFNRSFINATANQQLNRSAELTFKGLAFTAPAPVIDSNDDNIWETCSICTEKLYSGGTYIFNTTHWTSFAAADTVTSCPINISTSTTLTSDYVGYLTATEACITFTASNIVLDCAGFSLTSNGSGRGVRASSRRNIIVKNCTIGNFTDGFSFFQVNGSTVTNNTVYNSSDDNYDLSTMNRSNITNNSAVHSDDDNIIFVRSDNNNISGNFVDNATGSSASNGIVLFNMSNNNTVEQNIVTNSQEAGITVQLESDSNTIRNNTIAYSQNDNIYIADSNYNIVDNNTITNASDDNIELNNASFSSVVNNNLTRSFDNLMSIFNSSDNNVTNNIFFNTSDPSGTANGLTILSASQNNVIQNNSFFQTQNDTIFSSNSYNNTIMSNTIFLSSDDGIRLENNSNIRVQFNNISDSAEQGIDIENSSQLLIADNNASNNTENNIRLRNSTLSNVSNNTASNATGTAFPDGIEIDHGSRDILVFNNTLSFNADGLQLLNSTNVTAIYNIIFNNTDDGIDINSSGQNISSNLIYYNQFGVSFTPGNSTTVENNTIFNNTNDSVLISRQSNHILITGNYLENHTSAGGVAVNIIGNESLQQNITIINNIINNTGDNGIQVINLTRQIRIINNSLSNIGLAAPSNGISIRNATDINISGNNITSDTDISVQILDSSNVSVEFNRLEDSGGNFIDVSRTNETLLNNNTVITNDQIELKLLTAGNVTILDHVFANYSIIDSGLTIRDTDEAEIYYLNRSMTQSNENWSFDVIISYNGTFVNSTNAPGLNQSANLTFYGLPFANPTPLVDVEDDGTFVDCTTTCTEISYAGGTYLYNVTQWTNHSSGEGGGADIIVVDGVYNATITPEQTAICIFQSDNLSATQGCVVVDDNPAGNVTALSIMNNGSVGFGLNVSADSCPFESGCIQQMKVNGTAGLSMTASCNPALNFITIPVSTEVNLHRNVSPGEMVFVHLNYTFSIAGTPPGNKAVVYNFTAVTGAPYFDPAC